MKIPTKKLEAMLCSDNEGDSVIAYHLLKRRYKFNFVINFFLKDSIVFVLSKHMIEISWRKAYDPFGTYWERAKYISI